MAHTPTLFLTWPPHGPYRRRDANNCALKRIRWDRNNPGTRLQTDYLHRILPSGRIVWTPHASAAQLRPDWGNIPDYISDRLIHTGEEVLFGASHT